jgi:formamidopyrimidine-DNA glycosylase
MPEGPEILFLSMYLKNKLSDKYISLIGDYSPEINIPLDLEGKIIDISSKGKILFFKLSSKTKNKFYYMHIHFGLSGWIVFNNTSNYLKYKFIVSDNINKSKDYNIGIEDKPRLSKLNVYSEDDHSEIITKLGIDIFQKEFTLENFKFHCTSRKVGLLGLLLKQEIFCGIGNYIKNEAIYLSNVHYQVKSNELTDEQYKTLYNSILFVSYSSLKEQLDSKNMFNKLEPKYTHNIPTILEVPYNYKIYKQSYTPDGKPVKKIQVAGRDTYIVG